MLDDLINSFRNLMSAIPVEKIGAALLVCVMVYGLYVLINDL